MTEKITLFTKIKNNRYIPIVITGFTGVFYTFQAWNYSRLQRSLLDEGNYLLKGYLFVTGRLIPYQDYGTWTNKMPISFLVPGYVQQVFGPGLETGRNYAFALSILILVASIMLAYRLGGRWGAALTAVVMASNPALLKIYTRVLTEGLTSLLLLVTLLLILGKDRSNWQLILGSFVAGLIPVTRVNLTPILILVILYLFWKHGANKGIGFLLVSLIPFVGFHILYWPGIMQLWIKWIPKGLFESVDLWKTRFGDAVGLYDPDVGISNRLLAFSQGIRFHFAPVLGVFMSITLWPKTWKDQSKKHTAIFLLTLYGFLFVIHLGAAIFMDFNIHAFGRYLSPFSVLGIFLILISWESWNFNIPKWRQIVIGLGIIVFTLIIGYSISEQSSIIGIWFKRLFEIQNQNNGEGQFFVTIWDWWVNVQTRLGWDYAVSLRVAILGISFIVVLVILLGFWFGYKRLLQAGRLRLPDVHFSYVLISFFVISVLLSPTKLLGGGFVYYDCKPGAIGHYEGAVLAASPYVNQGDQVFYVGKDTQAVLLGLIEKKAIQIYPQQLNAIHSFRIGGDTDQLTKSGFWNDSVAQEWVDKSDVLLFEQQSYATWFADTFSALDLSGFSLVNETNNTGCTYNQRIYIYGR